MLRSLSSQFGIRPASSATWSPLVKVNKKSSGCTVEPSTGQVNTWKAIVVVGRVVGRASVEGVDPGRGCPADDRVVSALGQVV